MPIRLAGLNANCRTAKTPGVRIRSWIRPLMAATDIFSPGSQTQIIRLTSARNTRRATTPAWVIC